MSDNEPGLTGEGDSPDGWGRSRDGTESAGAGAERDLTELIAELELLRQENRRLRESYRQVKTTQHRRVALGLAALGLTATLGAVLFPPVRTVLLALGGTGLFVAVLTYYLTPERFVSADVGSEVYSALARNQAAIVSELGLDGTRVYVPVGEAETSVRLFVPQHPDFDIPDGDTLQSVFVVTEGSRERGVVLTPTGDGLFAEFDRALEGQLGDSPDELLPQLREGLVEQFEIANDIEFSVDGPGGRVTAEMDGSVYGDLGRFDHPASSFLAAGLARGLDRPVRVSPEEAGDSTVTFRWDTADE